MMSEVEKKLDAEALREVAALARARGEAQDTIRQQLADLAAEMQRFAETQRFFDSSTNPDIGTKDRYTPMGTLALAWAARLKALQEP